MPDAAHSSAVVDPGPRVAYLLKGWPRLSELFIASEIHRLEQLGVHVDLYVIKPPDEAVTHDVVRRIRATPQHLPAVTSLSSTTTRAWLRDNLGLFRPALRHALRHHPIGTIRAVTAAFGQSFRARDGFRLKRIYLKEFLLATSLVAELDARSDVSIVHAHFAHGTTTVAWLASILSGTPFSFTGHAKDIWRGSLNPAGLLERKLAAAKFVTTCTHANLDHLRELANPSGADRNVHLVYHGLNADFTEALARTEHTAVRKPAPQSPFRIVSVGRLVPKKGFDVLIAAVGRLIETGRNVELVIAGERGPERERLDDLVARLGLAGVVTFVGTVDQEQLLALYQGAHAFSLACRVDGDGDRDGIPNVLVEAMAAALPVVSTTVSGIPEVVEHGRTGLLVAPEDAEALARALAQLGDEPEFAAALGSAAARFVAEEFDGNRLARELVSLFDGAAR